MPRIHSNLNTTRTITGRLSCDNPNLMNIPARTEEGRKIRNCFKAKDGCVLVSGDYSQVEMRVACAESKDPEMTKIFLEGLDIHTQTAARIFNISYAEVTASEQNEMRYRYPAKQVGFGILFQLTAAGLHDQMTLAGATGWTVETCQDLIDGWFGVFKNIRAHFGSKKDECRKYGYVTDMFNRRYLIPQVYSALEWIRDEAGRLACSYPIQGGAQGIMKRGMVSCKPIYKKYREWGFTCNPIMQIHDDMIWEVSEEVSHDFALEFKTAMESAVKLHIPIKTDIKIGPVWGTMKKVKL